MSDMDDDELLAGEDDSGSESYDLTDEKEEALLQGDEDYSKPEYDKKGPGSDSDEQDILNLDIEEDFQDAEDKLLYDEEAPETKITRDEKFSAERAQSTQQYSKTNIKTSTNNKPTQKLPPVSKNSKNAFRDNTKKVSARGRGWRGTGRGNFQSRSNFVKNTQQGRRNGKVLINPRFEGTVPIKENARLAWDSQYPQNQNTFIQPWSSANTTPRYDLQGQMLNNLVNLMPPPSQNLLPQSSQNFFQPVSNSYQPTLSFEPPPGVQNETSLQSYNGQPQVSRGMYSLPPPSTSSLQPYTQGNNSLTTNGLKNKSGYNSHPNYDYYNNSTSQNYSQNFRQSTFAIKSQTYNSNFAVQNKNLSYVESDFQGRTNSSFSNNSTSNTGRQGTYGGTSAFKSNNQMDIKSNNANRITNYQSNFNQNHNSNSLNSNRQPNQTKNDLNKQNFKRDEKNSPVKNLDGDRSRRENESSVKYNLPEKKPKLDESVKKLSETKTDNLFKGKTTLGDKISPMEEEEDEETKLYRLKIEEQKREREKVLQMKEERRRQQMRQKQQEEEKNLPPPEPEKQTPQITVKKQHLLFDAPKKQNQQLQQKYQQNRSGSFNYQKNNFNPPANTAAVENQYVQKFNLISVKTTPDQYQNPVQVSNSADSGFSNEFPNLTFKVTNTVAENSVKSVPKTEASSNSFMSNRVVVVKAKTKTNTNTSTNQGGVVTNSIAAKTVSNETKTESCNVGQGLSSFFNNRKVLKKDNSLLDTRLVVVNNLSTTTNQDKLMALTRGIGEIQKLRVDKQERQATILFKSVASAHAFFKKYQRRILDDLSVIEVKLEPMI